MTGAGPSVPRGTLQEPGELAAAVAHVFGAAAPLARRFAGHLATSGVERGLIGPREVDRVWERHLLNCGVVAQLLPEDAGVLDVGSGAGLPGLALALARPDVRVVLVEPLQRRCAWLREVVEDLGVPVRVVRGRAPEVLTSSLDAGEPTVDPAQVVTARAVAPLERLAGWCLPLVAPGGQLLALKGGSAAEELAAAEDALRRAGAQEWDVVTVGGDVIPTPTTVVRVRVGPGRRSGDRAATPHRRARRGRGRA